MIVMIGISSQLWNQAALRPMSVTWSWKPMRPSGWPMPGVGVARLAIVAFATEASLGSSVAMLAIAGSETSSGWAGAACEAALIASDGGGDGRAVSAAGRAGAAAWALAAAGARAIAAAMAKSLKMVFIDTPVGRWRTAGLRRREA